MDVMISPSSLCGSVLAVPSKSVAHRALICAALSPGESRILRPGSSKDIEATVRCLKQLGAQFIPVDDALSVTGLKTTALPAACELDCGESGSTLRFLLPVCAALGVHATFTGHGRLPKRPLGSFTNLMQLHGVEFTQPEGGSLPLTLQGRLDGTSFEIDGTVSSQYLTGLLLAAPLSGAGCDILLTSPLQSKPYVDLTLGVLRSFGIRAKQTPHGYQVPGGQRYLPRSFAVEGDYSNAAFFLCAGALSGNVTVAGLRPDSLQGDRKIISLLRQMGCPVSIDGGQVRAAAAPLHAIDIDAADIPDLVPVLAVTAALSQGTTTVFHAARLRYKESDRLLAVQHMLAALGSDVSVADDGLVIHGQKQLQGGTVDGCNDHRIVMAAAVAALGCSGPVFIHGAQAVEKSYPQFFDDYIRLGGKANVLNVGN